MLRVHSVKSLDAPTIQPYLTLRRSEEHERQGIVVVQGEKGVVRLLESGLGLVSLLLTEEWLENLRPRLEARGETIDVHVGSKPLLESITGHSMYKGVMAVGRLPVPPTLEEVLMTNPRPYLLGAVEGISNADNLGVVARNFAAFGVQGMIVGETSSSPYLRRAVRSSMGAIFKLAVVPVRRLVETLDEIKRHRIRCIGTCLSDGARKLSQVDYTEDCCLVFGSEGFGLSSEVLERCDQSVKIPMQNGIDSLNVGSAAAAILYEVNRQRGRA